MSNLRNIIRIDNGDGSLVDLWDLGFRVLRLPPLEIPEVITDGIVIPGRSEALLDSHEQMKDLRKTAELSYVGNDVMSAVWNLVEAKRVQFGNEKQFVYLSSGRAAQTVDRLILDWHRFSFNWVVKPLKRESDPAVIVGKSTEATNPGNWYSEPTIKLGVGTERDLTVTVGDQVIELTGVEGEIVIDSEAKMVTENGVAIDHKMSGDFPRIEAGATVVLTCPEADTMQTVPNWRWR